jgi:hypothetical protein
MRRSGVKVGLFVFFYLEEGQKVIQFLFGAASIEAHATGIK